MMSRVYGSPFTKMANGSFMMCMDNTNCMSLAFQLLGHFKGRVSLAHCNTRIQKQRKPEISCCASVVLHFLATPSNLEKTLARNSFLDAKTIKNLHRAQAVGWLELSFKCRKVNAKERFKRFESYGRGTDVDEPDEYKKYLDSKPEVHGVDGPSHSRLSSRVGAATGGDDGPVHRRWSSCQSDTN